MGDGQLVRGRMCAFNCYGRRRRAAAVVTVASDSVVVGSKVQKWVRSAVAFLGTEGDDVGDSEQG